MTEYLKSGLEFNAFFKKDFYHPFLYKDAVTRMVEKFLLSLG
jgi:hypothetical protein